MDPVARSDPHLRRSAACSGRRDCARGHSSLVPLLSERAGTTSRPDAPALERHARGRRRSLRARPGRAGSRTADRVGQVLAGEPFGRSHGSSAALGNRGRPSPVAGASVGALLAHLRDAWNHDSAQTPGAHAVRLEQQPIVLTVPASFDEEARELTVQAAQQAGLAHVILLEEPIAALYCVDRRAPPRQLRPACPTTHWCWCATSAAGRRTSA